MTPHSWWGIQFCFLLKEQPTKKRQNKWGLTIASHPDILGVSSRVPAPWTLGRIAWLAKRTSAWEASLEGTQRRCPRNTSTVYLIRKITTHELGCSAWLLLCSEIVNVAQEIERQRCICRWYKGMLDLPYSRIRIHAINFYSHLRDTKYKEKRWRCVFGFHWMVKKRSKHSLNLLQDSISAQDIHFF